MTIQDPPSYCPLYITKAFSEFVKPHYTGRWCSAIHHNYFLIIYQESIDFYTVNTNCPAWVHLLKHRLMREWLVKHFLESWCLENVRLYSCTLPTGGMYQDDHPPVSSGHLQYRYTRRRIIRQHNAYYIREKYKHKYNGRWWPARSGVTVMRVPPSILPLSRFCPLSCTVAAHTRHPRRASHGNIFSNMDSDFAFWTFGN